MKLSKGRLTFRLDIWLCRMVSCTERAVLRMLFVVSISRICEREWNRIDSRSASGSAVASVVPARRRDVKIVLNCIFAWVKLFDVVFH